MKSKIQNKKVKTLDLDAEDAVYFVTHADEREVIEEFDLRFYSDENSFNPFDY